MKLKKIGLSHTEQTVYFALLKRGFATGRADSWLSMGKDEGQEGHQSGWRNSPFTWIWGMQENSKRKRSCLTGCLCMDSSPFKTSIIQNLIRFAHNWNVGTLEQWNIGFWETAAVVYWQNPIDKEVNRWETSWYNHYSNIPLFHYSIIPCAGQYGTASQNSF